MLGISETISEFPLNLAIHSLGASFCGSQVYVYTEYFTSECLYHPAAAAVVVAIISGSSGSSRSTTTTNSIPSSTVRDLCPATDMDDPVSHIFVYGSDSIVMLYYTSISEPKTFIDELYGYKSILLKKKMLYIRACYMYKCFHHAFLFIIYTIYNTNDN